MTGRPGGGFVLSSLAIAVLLAGCSASGTPSPWATPAPTPPPTLAPTPTPTPTAVPPNIMDVINATFPTPITPDTIAADFAAHPDAAALVQAEFPHPQETGNAEVVFIRDCVDSVHFSPANRTGHCDQALIETYRTFDNHRDAPAAADLLRIAKEMHAFAKSVLSADQIGGVDADLLQSFPVS